MFFSTVELPEPFAAALAAGAAADVGDAPAETPEALFGRALARAALGRDDDARLDLSAAEPALGDACRIERLWLDLRRGRPASQVAAALAEIAQSETLPPQLRARAWHIAGLARDKTRATPAAVDALLLAAQLYHAAGQRLAEAQVYDTLGTVEADRGRLDNALHFYAMSLVDKALLNDRPGLALTLGNIGRVHLRAGRYEQARGCFERDLEITVALGDPRGEARMHEDLGRAALGLGDYAKAQRHLTQSLAKALQHGLEDLQFFARKDLALTHLAEGRLEQAAGELSALREALRPETEPYLRLVLCAAEGELLLAQRDPHSVAMLTEAADGFARVELPDLEIPARIALARALMAEKFTALAEQALLRGVRIARSDGYMRYLPLLNEAMASLELVEGAIDEHSRTIAGPGESSASGYVIRQRLGGGAFGEVLRAYDPQRCREVAIKRLRLDRLYDMKQRTRLLDSARIELEAAARVRHPGVVQVLALGTEPEGGEYVVQEFIAGRSLRALMPEDASADAALVLRYIEQIAGALAALHGAGVIHRDLKPDNVLVREDGSIVLVDFGIAHVVSSRRALGEAIAGTLEYMAPEQAAGKRIDPRADLYSLGVILYEWLTGTRPLRLRGGDFQELAGDLATRQPPPPAEFRPLLDPEVARLTMSLLEKRARRRPATAQDVGQECGRLAAICDKLRELAQ